MHYLHSFGSIKVTEPSPKHSRFASKETAEESKTGQGASFSRRENPCGESNSGKSAFISANRVPPHPLRVHSKPRNVCIIRMVLIYQTKVSVAGRSPRLRASRERGESRGTVCPHGGNPSGDRNLAVCERFAGQHTGAVRTKIYKLPNSRRDHSTVKKRACRERKVFSAGKKIGTISGKFLKTFRLNLLHSRSTSFITAEKRKMTINLRTHHIIYIITKKVSLWPSASAEQLVTECYCYVSDDKSLSSAPEMGARLARAVLIACLFIRKIFLGHCSVGAIHRNLPNPSDVSESS